MSPYNTNVAVRSARASSGPRVSGPDHDAVIVVEGVSKRYPRTPVTIFPPIVSMFDRNWFRRRRASSDAEAGSVGAEATSTDEEVRSAYEAAPGFKAPAPESRGPAGQRRDGLDDDDLDEDDEDDDEFDDEGPSGRPGGPTPDRPGEMFWALRDVSFRVPRGAALGILGGPDAGKSTLLGIIGGQSFPSEGRVLIRDRVSPLPDALARAFNMAAKGTHKLSLPMGARLLGIEGHLVKRHKQEIEELAGPVVGPDGQQAPGAMIRLAVATAVVLPTNVLLLDDFKGVDEAFVERVVDRVRQRLRRGSSLVLASRQPALVEQLCDEVIVLDAGSIIHGGDAKGALARYQAGQSGSRAGAAGAARGQSSGTLAPSRHLPRGQTLDVTSVVPAFNASAALLSATLGTATGRSKRIDATVDEVVVEIHFETAVPNVEAHCGVAFVPRGGQGTGIRLELPEPLRFVDPATYVLVARPLPGALPSGAYEVRADAIVSNPAEGRATVIARDIGRVRIVGDELDAAEPAEPPITDWDGREMWRAEAEWSID
jgi:ABC-type polysaccharide/polyol phosphate transport system ATPase subunit